MQTQIKVSVIIPVYNTAKYLRHCLDSLQNQTLKEIEVICVDDGSTDDSMAILHEYKAKDKRFIIAETPRQTAGGARNKGLDNARGEYIICLDSDDFFEIDMLECMYKKASGENLDMLVCCADRFIEDKETYEPAPWLVKLPLWENVKNHPFCPRRDISSDIFRLVTGCPWTKLWRRLFIEKHSLRYQQIMNSNDTFFTYAGLFLAERVSHIDKVFIHWRIRSNSLTTGFAEFPICFVDALCALTQRIRSHPDASRVWDSLMELCVEISTWRYEKTAADSKHIVKEAIQTRLEPCCQLVPYTQNHNKKFTNYQKDKFREYLHLLEREIITTFVVPLDLRKKQAQKLLKILPNKLSFFTNAIVPIVAINAHNEKRLADLESSEPNIHILRCYPGCTQDTETQINSANIGKTITLPGMVYPTVLSKNEWEKKIRQGKRWRALPSLCMYILNHFEYPWKCSE